MLREHDPAFSAKEQAIVGAARRYLERQWDGPVDAYFSVERTAEGYEVFVKHVSWYENSQPMFALGAGSIVYLRDDGTIIRYLPGE
jgi:hypothetical protein